MWRDVAQENFTAVSGVRASRMWRSCVNRAYYAAFALITEALIRKGLAPRRDFGTWSHMDLPNMAAVHLLDGSTAASNLGYAVRRLYRLRLAADYRPELTVAQREAFESVGLMSQVFRQVKNEFQT